MNSSQIVIALLVSLLIVIVAFWRGWLSRSGALGALIVGTLTLGFGGWQWGALLGVFFVTSSVLSKFKEEQKRRAAEKFDKGHRRDIMQAFANGGVGALLALASAIAPSPLWFLAYLGVMGTVTADTWATELGTLSKRPPRMITTGRVVEVGTSGGITPLGTSVSFVGGLIIGGVAGLWFGAAWWAYALLGALAGLVGSLVDSLLGATVQRIFWDDVKQKETEKRFKYGRELAPLRGYAWMNNDMVNLLSSLAGGAVATGLGLFFGLA